MTLRKVGYFRDLPHGEADCAALGESSGTGPLDHEDAVLTYLTKGNVLATSPALVHDVLDPGLRPIGTLQILTDGTWEWPSDLAYYVREHHVRLPAEFLQHMALRRWEVPQLSEEQVMELLADG